jgi:hypothetical protein
MKGNSMLTQAELKSQLHYNPETGIFTRMVSNNNKIKVGDVAGGKHNQGYMVIGINGKLYLAHRLAWLYVHGEFPENDIDHISGIKDSNFIKNLRVSTRSQNLFNRGVTKNNTSGYKGVSFDKATNKWMAKARLNGKRYYLGLFVTPEKASEAYQAFSKNNHGEFYMGAK